MLLSIRNWAAIGIGGVLLIAPASRAEVSADDFLPVVQGGSAEVKTPADVKVEENIVIASSAQDAINAAVDKIANDLNAGNGSGAEKVQFPGGTGYVASGMETYRVMENPTASRLSQRQAYVTAFIQAKKNLAEFMNHLTHEGKSRLRRDLAAATTEKDDLANITTDSEESMNQAVHEMLSAFSVYEVKDDASTHTVYVTVVSTPKMRSKVNRLTPNDIAVDDLRDGITQVLNEVRSGLVPPVGGRIITIRKTGEMVFVGFGSEVALANRNAAVQAKLNLEVQKIARMRAQHALCELINGDEVTWSKGFNANTHEETKDFEPTTQNDPLAPNPAGVKKLEAQREAFLHSMSTTEIFQNASHGVLPSGVNVRTWLSDDHNWAFAMAVYIPSQSNSDAGAGKAGNNVNSDPVHPERTGNGFKDEDNPNVPRPSADLKPGPTGKADKNDF